jgi:excisionase family DNA binding protein
MVAKEVSLILCPKCGILPELESESAEDVTHPRKKLYRYRCPSCGIVGYWDANSARQAIYEWNANRRFKGNAPVESGISAQIDSHKPKAQARLSVKPATIAQGETKSSTARAREARAAKRLNVAEQAINSSSRPETCTNESARSSREAAQLAANPDNVAALRSALGVLYSLEDVSAALNTTTRTIQSYIKSGKLKAVKIAGQWKITADNLKKFIDAD